MMRYQRSSSYQNVMRSNRYKPILVILLVGLGSWGWRALICAAVAVFVWFMARRSSSKSTI